MLKVNDIVTWGHGTIHARLAQLTLIDVFMPHIAVVETTHDVKLETGEVVPTGTQLRVPSNNLRHVS